MALVGTLSTMPLPDLLQWLGGGGKTGKLRVERNKIIKRILFQDGRVVACSSNEPRELIGHFLVSRGKITEDTLREALTLKENRDEQLGEILIDLKAIERPELTRSLTAQAEESIFSLFDWKEAVFRFEDEEIDPSAIAFPIELRVEDVLLRGMQRLDEAQRIRTVFDDPGIVLRHTGKKPPEAVLDNRMARGIYDSVNGERTVAEILLHAHASEFLVTKFLFELFRSGIVEITRVKSLESEEPATRDVAIEPDETKTGAAAGPAVTPPEPSPPPAAVAAESASAPSPPVVAPESATEAPTHAAPAAAVAKPLVAGSEIPSAAPATSLTDDVGVVGRLMSRGEYEAALQILDANYKANPGDDALRRLLAEAEAAFLEKTYRYHLSPGKIVRLAKPPEELEGERMSPEEFFLLSRIEGTAWDVKSIIQISPIREIDALRTMKRMLEKGFIELSDPD